MEADSVLEVYLAFGTVPEVDGLGDEGVVLGLEELLEEVVEDGSLALADVLAFGGLVMTVAGCTGVGAGGCAGGLVIVHVGTVVSGGPS